MNSVGVLGAHVSSVPQEQVAREREQARFMPVFLEQGEIAFLLVTVEGRSLVKLEEEKEHVEAEDSRRAQRARRFSLREWLRRR